MYFQNKKIKKVCLGYVQISGGGSDNITAVNYHIDSSNTIQLFKISGNNALDYIPSKSGYTFVGWREDTTANETILTNKTVGNTEINLYGVKK